MAIGATIQGGVWVSDVTELLLLAVTFLWVLRLEEVCLPNLLKGILLFQPRKARCFLWLLMVTLKWRLKYIRMREMVGDNKLVGQFTLIGILPAPCGVPLIEVPPIEVIFYIDANSIMHVSAKDKGARCEQ